MRPNLCEDGTNVAIGTKFIAKESSRVLPWYKPVEGNTPQDWKEKWKKLRDRFEKTVDEGYKMECYLIQRRIPQSRAGHQEYPGVLQGKHTFRACNGIWTRPTTLIGTNWEPLIGLFPFNNIRGEPMLDSQQRPIAFRLGAFHHFIICHDTVTDTEEGFRSKSHLIDLAKDATNLVYQLPSEIACSLWRNFPDGFSKKENADDSLWYDALFQLALQLQPGGPLYTTRYDWQDNGYISLVGDGLFPRLPDFDASTSLDPPKVPKDQDYPMAYYAKLPDLARASVAAIDEILQRGVSSIRRGQRFGDWTIVGETNVGLGGNGVVWQCEKNGVTKAAIKFFNREDIRRRFSNRPDELNKRERRFRDEIIFLTREARRPGILPLVDSHLMYQSSSTNDVLWFVMPWADPFPKLSGENNLHDLVNKFHIIASTLAELHAEGKWHRDLHPGNLFLFEGKPTIGDFGLVDYPDKESLTGQGERIGNRDYVAPELRECAEHTPADKADVYSLAKCFWVLASGKPVPPDGQLRRETQALKLSTHCPHKYADSLDALLEKSTEYEPTLRPAMKDFAAELSEWLKIGKVSSSSGIDLSALAKECRGIIESKMVTEHSKSDIVKEAGIISKSFAPMFELMHKQIMEVTGLTPVGLSVNYQNNTGLPEMSHGAVVVSKFGREVKATIKLGHIEITLRGCVLFEVLSDKRIRIIAGFSDHPLFPIAPYALCAWKKEIVAPIGSAQLLNDVELLKQEFLEKLPLAIQIFAAQIKASKT